MRESEVRRLVGFETASDGTAVKLFAEDVAGRETAISMRIETLTALLVTPPRMASNVIKRWRSDPRTRIADALTDFRMELSQDGRRILPFGTQEGSTISFSLSKQLSERMGRAHLRTDG